MVIKCIFGPKMVFQKKKFHRSKLPVFYINWSNEYMKHPVSVSSFIILIKTKRRQLINDRSVLVIFTLGRPSTLTPEDGDTQVGLSQSWKSTVWINTILFKRTYFKLNFHMHGSLRKTIGSKTARRLLKIWLRKEIYSRLDTNQWRITDFIKGTLIVFLLF